MSPFLVRSAVAGDLDVSLLNLCGPGVSRPLAGGDLTDCGWVQRDASGRVTGVKLDEEATSRFRSLMSELGVVMAPQVVTPADTIGFAGFQISAELGITQINNKATYWDGVKAVAPQNRLADRPQAWLSTVGVFVRKGIWLPLPSMEVGAGVVHLLQSQMVAYQGYAKLAIHEGFSDWPLPSLAGRAALSHVTGSEQVRLDIASFDVLISKAFGVGGTFRAEPFGGWSYLMIKARSNVIDLTPGCDGFLTAGGGNGGAFCGPTSPDADLSANFAFPNQDTITRRRFFGGMKLKFAAVFVAGQYEYLPAGRSRDESVSSLGARDGSDKQTRVSLSGGFDF
ncbi:MAG: hypothetical protein SF187_24105 [Deltaproteobacteria bacterium]|nr:hypothetical protein [Deltaproteobacteria bacterium]